MKKNTKNRFGSIAVVKGFITEKQLIEALTIQAKENVEQEKHRLIGQIMVERGYLTTAQVDEILETMNQRIMYMISVGR